MTAAEREVFLDRPLVAVLATRGARGRIHAVPVWYCYRAGRFEIITDRGSQKQRNAERFGRATLVIDEREPPYRYLTAEGPIEVVDLVTYDQRLALHTRYRGADAARAVVDQGGHERMVTLILRPERWLERQ